MYETSVSLRRHDGTIDVPVLTAALASPFDRDADLAWRTAAACAGSDIDFFSAAEAEIGAAASICRDCPAVEACLASALRDPAGDIHGFHAGMTERGLRSVRREVESHARATGVVLRNRSQSNEERVLDLVARTDSKGRRLYSDRGIAVMISNNDRGHLSNGHVSRLRRQFESSGLLAPVDEPAATTSQVDPASDPTPSRAAPDPLDPAGPEHTEPSLHRPLHAILGHKPDTSGMRTRRSPRLVLVDLENLTGKSPRACSPAEYRATVENLQVAIHLDPVHDRLVIAVNPALAYISRDAAPSARILTRTGENGADQRLCDELADLALITRRYPEVVLASGDHVFADPIAELGRHGITTTVAALPGQLALRLRIAACRVVWLAPPVEEARHA